MTGGERLRHVPVNSEGAALFRTFTTGKAGKADQKVCRHVLAFASCGMTSYVAEFTNRST